MRKKKRQIQKRKAALAKKEDIEAGHTQHRLSFANKVSHFAEFEQPSRDMIETERPLFNGTPSHRAPSRAEHSANGISEEVIKFGHDASSLSLEEDRLRESVVVPP